VAAFLPCLIAVVVTGISGIVLIQRKRFHSVVSWFLLRCAEKGPLKVAFAVLGLIAGVILTVIQTIRYMK
jgi:hypothetical protein